MISNSRWLIPTILFFCQCVLAKNSNCVLIDYQVKCTVNEQKLFQEESVLLQINSRLGDEFAKVEIPYSKRMRVSILGAQIETVEGVVIRELKKSEIVDRSAISEISLYEDDFVKSFELKHNVYPYRIRYSYKYQEDEFQEITAWYPVIHTDVPTQHASLKISIPFNYPVYKYVRGNVSQIVDSTDTGITYTFSVDSLQTMQSEFYSPLLSSLLPMVRVVPRNFKWMFAGSHENWVSYGNWMYSLIKNTDVLPETDKQVILRLVKGKTDTMEIIKVLYNYLQDNMRYINVSIDVGGLKPYAAEYVSKNRYGDCKALSIYMKAMLRAVGINSHYTAIYAGDVFPDFMPDLVSHQFNHAMVIVPLSKDTLFLECTNNSIPCGYQGTFTQNRAAFIISEHSSQLIKTPSLSIEDVKETKCFSFEISSMNDCRLNMKNTFRGKNFDLFNSLHSDYTNNDIEKLIRERYFRFPSFDLIDWSLKKPGRDSAYIILSANMNLQNFMQNYGQDFGFAISGVDLPKFEPPSERKLPLCFEYPIYQSDTFKFSLAAGHKLKVIPPSVSFQSKFGDYSYTAIPTDGEIVINREFKIRSGNYSLEEYPAFYKFISNIQKADQRIILLTKN